MRKIIINNLSTYITNMCPKIYKAVLDNKERIIVSWSMNADESHTNFDFDMALSSS